MALGLNKTKRRIASVRSTQKITKAMGMVATVKLKRFKDAHFASEAYFASLEEAMGRCFAFLTKKDKTPYLKENESAKGNLVIFLTSDLGLCAAYNSNLFRFLDKTIDKENDTVIALGAKGLSHLLHEGGYLMEEAETYGLSLNLTPREIETSAKLLQQAFLEGRYRKIKVIYTRYVNSLSFVPEEYTLLPVSISYQKKEDEEWCPPIFEPSAKEQSELLMGQYLSGILSCLITESQLSEQASRRNAMDSANDNADELLKQLSVEYNKARQSSITQEITEVVAGASNAK